MKIKLTAPDSVDIFLSPREAEWAGAQQNEISAASLCESGAMTFISELLETFCGLKRSGGTVAAEFLPYRSGSCILRLRFTDAPADRLFMFNQADDMLDALGKLRHSDNFDTISQNIHSAEDKFFIFIPHDVELTDHELALLNEYRA